MADDIKKAEIQITSTYDGTGAQRAAADQEKLTNTGKGLATALPELNTATQAFTISTEAEYLAIQKAHDTLAAKIPVLQAAGKSTAEYEKTLANLSAALSTEQALNVASTMEERAAAAAKEEAAAAASAKARAEEEDAAATTLNANAQREMMVLMREGMMGRVSRIPGSLSALAEYALPVTGAMTAGIMSASMAAMVLYEWFEKAHEEIKKIREESARIDAGTWEDQAHAVSDAADAMQRVDDEITRITDHENAWREATENQNEALAQQGRQVRTIMQAEEQRDLAAVQGNQKAEEAIRKRYEVLREMVELEMEQKKATEDKLALDQAQAAEATAKAHAEATASALGAAVTPEAVSRAKSSVSALNQKESAADAAFMAATGTTSFAAAMAEFQRRQAAASAFGSEAQNPSYIATSSGNFITEAGAARQSLAGAQQAYDALKSAQEAITANSKTIDDWKAHIKTLSDAASAAVQTLEQAQENLTQAQRAYHASSSQLASDRATHDIVGAIGKGITPQMIQGAYEANRAYDAGQALTEKQTEAIQGILRMAEQNHLNAQALLEAIAQAEQTGKSVQNTIERLSNMISRMGQGGNGTS